MKIGEVNVLHGTLSRVFSPFTVALWATILVIVALMWGALQLHITLAGFLNGESVWSKAQKDAIEKLSEYAESGEPEDLAGFRQAFAILDNDRIARDRLTSGQYDPAHINLAFQRGHIMPEAQGGMMFMLTYFNGFYPIRDALEAWRASDEPLSRLNAIADELEGAYAQGRPAAAQSVLQQRRHIQAINAEIGPLTERFSIVVARGTVWMATLLFASLVVCAAIIIIFLRHVVKRTLRSLHAGEERFRTMFEHASDGIVMVDDTGHIVYLNVVACAWLGRQRSDLIGTCLAEYLKTAHPLDLDGQHSIQIAPGVVRNIDIQSTIVRWDDRAIRQAILRDITERLALERDRRLQAEALESIAEGVLIVDADRNILYANDACFRITGHSQKRLLHQPLFHGRQLPDGRPIPDSLWHEVDDSNHWQGEVRSRRHDGKWYPEQLSISAVRGEASTVQYYVAVFSNITVQKTAQAHLEKLARTDPLTGLANRSEFERLCQVAIDTASDTRSALAVLYIDLDDFKSVNDSLTHTVGDRLLCVVSQRIQKQLRPGDVASRIGGDEFTVLVPHLDTREDICSLAQRVLSALAETYVVDGHAIVVSASIGIAGYPIDGDTAHALIANADAAMYAAKSAERNSYQLYSPRMHAAIRNRLTLASELRKALLAGEFHIDYQPSMSMRTGQMTGVEALIRWNRFDREPIGPAEFIGVAESLGLSRGIDHWVLETVLEQVGQWERRSPTACLRVGVNISASTFAHPEFASAIERLLTSAGVSASRLMIEITEGTMLRLGEETNQTLQALANLGVSVAIDDFGTGYSSLAYLKLPAITHVKIDRSFVSGIPGREDDMAIIKAMFAIAGQLQLQTIAEGIETNAQHDFLRDIGCHEGQGFLYSAAVSAEEITEILVRPLRASQPKLRIVQPDQ